ncbi:RNB domain-containing ribonuclease [Nakamurella lactea]|uniref:RNB domain-containing ribonuclease n=1 Tax=Nakamurella lactea TaxID=459515 RepID=UPI0004905105|nr:RNB domain-containing ribonuclease [Nakamurella lactea]
MPFRKINTAATDIDFAGIRRDLEIPAGYPQPAVDEAVQIAQHLPTAPDDATDIPFVTLDPVGSKDLDQAVHLEAGPDGGYLVRYAIADVASYVGAGGAVDAESRRRGQTYYSPDLISPLHPFELSEGAASLLPDQIRAAVLWTITLDASGAPTDVRLTRSMVRSVAQLDYPGAQADADAGRLHPSIALLPEVGKLRLAAARARHAISLDLPDVEVQRGPDGNWTLELRAVLPIEQWNAEISLLTGMCAATIMLGGGYGVLRTLPEPSDRDVARLRKETAALGIPWSDELPPGDVIAGLDGSKPADAAFLQDALKLLRGAGYTPFTGTPPADHSHAGVGAPYAHVTAPLRRLVDRFGTEICLAQVAGTEVPDWVRSSLDAIADTMEATDRTAHDLERNCVGVVSAFLLKGREGEQFTGVVVQIDQEKKRATIAVDEPPIQAKCASDGLTEGTRVTVELVSVDDRNFEMRAVT